MPSMFCSHTWSGSREWAEPGRVSGETVSSSWPLYNERPEGGSPFPFRLAGCPRICLHSVFHQAPLTRLAWLSGVDAPRCPPTTLTLLSPLCVLSQCCPNFGHLCIAFRFFAKSEYYLNNYLYLIFFLTLVLGLN